MQADVVEHFRRGKVLRISADNCFAMLTVVWIEDEVTDDFHQPRLGKSTFHHRKQGAYSIGDLVFIIRLIPCIEILVRREDSAHLGIGAVADNRQTAILQKLRYISRISNGNLLPGIMYGLALFDSSLELKDGNRDTIYEDQHVGSSQRTILNAVLVYYLEDVLVWVFEIDVLDMQSGFCGIFANKIEAFVNEPKCLAVSFIQRIVADMFEFIDYGLDFGFRKSSISVVLAQIVANVPFNENVFKSTMHRFAVDVVIILVLEQLYNCQLKLFFCEFSSYELCFHALSLSLCFACFF